MNSYTHDKAILNSISTNSLKDELKRRKKSNTKPKRHLNKALVIMIGIIVVMAIILISATSQLIAYSLDFGFSHFVSAYIFSIVALIVFIYAAHESIQELKKGDN